MKEGPPPPKTHVFKCCSCASPTHSLPQASAATEKPNLDNLSSGHTTLMKPQRTRREQESKPPGNDLDKQAPSPSKTASRHITRPPRSETCYFPSTDCAGRAPRARDHGHCQDEGPGSGGAQRAITPRGRVTRLGCMGPAQQPPPPGQEAPPSPHVAQAGRPWARRSPFPCLSMCLHCSPLVRWAGPSLWREMQPQRPAPPARARTHPQPPRGTD